MEERPKPRDGGRGPERDWMEAGQEPEQRGRVEMGARKESGGVPGEGGRRVTPGVRLGRAGRSLGLGQMLRVRLGPREK